MAKIMVIATDWVEDLELISPTGALTQAGHSTTLVSFEAGQSLAGKAGSRFTADAGIDDVSIDEFDRFDALLIPGGFSPDQLRVDARFVALVKAFLVSDKPVFAICHGPQLFIQTGLTDQLRLTGYTSIQPDLRYAGATVVDAPVVYDEAYRLVTSRTPADLEAFNEAIVAELAKETAAQN
ncbi:type 1 glutamine amidotransferase domain-containing protein [Lacticaseibacillus absianus]|uniref:type 1 glutamine amidotransferase domain-containing protein n=1 Tax=Lacticaseibacillus absianus TaxID=2729623 RepID=UPI0015C6CC79|nr:type 1 glutamine amidotransferase domain-containing protein [Lacticaseibacillus absianus]